MPEILEILRPEIDATIASLNAKNFTADPIAGDKYSKIVSVVSSAYKRHGHILERAILECLKANDRFEVWQDPLLSISDTADLMVNSFAGNIEAACNANIAYADIGTRTIQVDALIYDRHSKSLSAYEIKRGFGLHDSGKKRSILRDLLCLQVVLKSYGERRDFDVQSARSQIIFYYGKRSLPAPISLIREELDGHFGIPMVDHIELVNAYYREQLHSILPA